jgi:zeaxanthin glucosyltransferase
VQTSGLLFHSIDGQGFGLTQFPKSRGTQFGPNTLGVIHHHASLVLNYAREAVLNAGIEALLVDQADLAASTLAEVLRIPFINLSVLPPIYLEDESPPFIYAWKPDIRGFDNRRNRKGNALLRRLVQPTLNLVNQTRRAWRLPEILDINQVFSRAAIIAQMPKVFDFPRLSGPSQLFHTGLFNDGRDLCPFDFPWHRLDGRPLVYASMGTVRYGKREVFEIIAKACAKFRVQLVISLGGMDLMPEELNDLPGNPIIVHYAPQWAILKHASLTICHGGVNTTLESVHHGVPLIAIPVADDQPGMAARIEWNGVGVALPIRNLSVDRLSHCIDTVLANAEYSSAVRSMQVQFRSIDGLDQAASIIQQVLSS